MHDITYRRVLLKISGEALGGGVQGIDPDVCRDLAGQIKGLVDHGVQIAVVCGGGNIFRGIQADHFRIDRTHADSMGMLATTINAIALREFIRGDGMDCEVLSALGIPGVVRQFDADAARRCLDAGAVVIFAAGTGHPYFSTDTAAVLRALQIHADILIKATKVDGVYSSDPVTNPQAQRFQALTYTDVIRQNLRVMDLTSITLCREQNLPVRVINMTQPGNLMKAIRGESIGTLIHGGNDND